MTEEIKEIREEAKMDLTEEKEEIREEAKMDLTEEKEVSKDNKEQEIASLKLELSEIKAMLSKLMSSNSSANSTQAHEKQTNQLTGDAKNPQSSTGNEGVPTDRQTIHRQTSASATQISDLIKEYRTELMVKFKGLTKQEFKVFSAIFILEQEGRGEVSYSLLAQKLGLTESSIRDYIMRLERKGVPVDKTKVNNKLILLKIRPELKQIATLDSLTKLREIRFTE